MSRPARLVIEKCVLSLTALGLVWGTALYYVRGSQQTDNDFWVFYRSGTRARARNWDGVYTRNDGANPFKYSPAALLPFRVMASFEEAVARRGWLLLQVLCYLLGYALLRRALLRMGSTRPELALALAFLMTARYYLDSLLCGQVSGTLFLLFSGGLLYWLEEREGAMTAAILPAALLKVGPGIHFGLLLSDRRRLLRAVGFSCVALILINVVLALWVGSIQVTLNLWKGWALLVSQDSEYYNVGISRIQSLKAMLWRLRGSGWIDPRRVEPLWLVAMAATVGAMAVFWAKSTSKDPARKALSYCLGIFAFLWFMPETFPYALVNLAIPLAVLMALPGRDGFTLAAIAAVLALCSLPGSDVAGDYAERIQANSLPFLATVLLGIACWRLALTPRNPRSTLRR